MCLYCKIIMVASSVVTAPQYGLDGGSEFHHDVCEGCPGRGSRWSAAPEDGPVDKVISEPLCVMESAHRPASLLHRNLLCLCQEHNSKSLLSLALCHRPVSETACVSVTDR